MAQKKFTTLPFTAQGEGLVPDTQRCCSLTSLRVPGKIWVLTAKPVPFLAPRLSPLDAQLLGITCPEPPSETITIHQWKQIKQR